MAEMNTSNETGRQRGGRRSKKLSTRVDMTPMVAAENARYRSVVDALDEMKINRVARYALADITPEEVKMLGE